MSPYQLFTVEGNIGAGKTSLARRLAEDMQARLILEGFEDNPFLPRFFEDFKKMAFATELYFMAERYHQLQEEMVEMELFQGRLIIDYLFCKSLLYARVNLNDSEYALFRKLFDIVNPRLPEPELVVYVHSEVPRLVRNIHQRGRDFEQGVDPEYLGKIQDTYFNYFRQSPQMRVLILECSELDYVKEEAHYQAILELVQGEHARGVRHFRFQNGHFDAMEEVG